MSPRPAALSHYIKRLVDEGYEVGVRQGHLVVFGVPYVNAQRQVLRGAVVTPLNIEAEQVTPPANHQVWWQGEFPCHHTGAPIEQLRHSSQEVALWEGFQVHHHFSNKPAEPFRDYYSKMVSYITIIQNEARAIDPTVDARTFNPIPSEEDESVFRYQDSASSRAEIMAVSAKLAKGKVAIVGLGGTGSYVMDLVAKTPVPEVHLFDGDRFHQHNAFRSPGAATFEALQEKPMKVDYYARLYDAMRRGIEPHPIFVTEENLSCLAGFDFVFLCVDKGPVRKLISGYLQGEGVSFVDVGMDLVLVPGENSLIGTCRVTTSTSTKSEHFARHAPCMEDDEDDLYRKNIQVADMNALNASLAVHRWKQLCGFYQDGFKVHHLTYSVNSCSMTRDELGNSPGEACEPA